MNFLKRLQTLITLFVAALTLFGAPAAFTSPSEHNTHLVRNIALPVLVVVAAASEITYKSYKNGATKGFTKASFKEVTRSAYRDLKNPEIWKNKVNLVKHIFATPASRAQQKTTFKQSAKEMANLARLATKESPVVMAALTLATGNIVYSLACGINGFIRHLTPPQPSVRLASADSGANPTDTSTTPAVPPASHSATPAAVPPAAVSGDLDSEDDTLFEDLDTPSAMGSFGTVDLRSATPSAQPTPVPVAAPSATTTTPAPAAATTTHVEPEAPAAAPAGPHAIAFPTAHTITTRGRQWDINPDGKPHRSSSRKERSQMKPSPVRSSKSLERKAPQSSAAPAIATPLRATAAHVEHPTLTEDTGISLAVEVLDATQPFDGNDASSPRSVGSSTRDRVAEISHSPIPDASPVTQTCLTYARVEEWNQSTTSAKPAPRVPSDVAQQRQPTEWAQILQDGTQQIPAGPMTIPTAIKATVSNTHETTTSKQSGHGVRKSEHTPNSGQAAPVAAPKPPVAQNTALPVSASASAATTSSAITAKLLEATHHKPRLSRQKRAALKLTQTAKKLEKTEAAERAVAEAEAIRQAALRAQAETAVELDIVNKGKSTRHVAPSYKAKMIEAEFQKLRQAQTS